MQFTIYKRMTLRGRKWFWRLQAGNNEVIAQGEAYNSRHAALEAVVNIREGAEFAPIRVKGED